MKLLPKEHGATCMFLACLLVGLASAQQLDLSLPAALVAGMFAALAGTFLTREPIVTLARAHRRLSARARHCAYKLLVVAGALLVGGGGVVLTQVPLGDLLPIAAVGVPLYGIILYAAIRGEAWRWWADVAGVTVAALAAPAMAVAVSGSLTVYEWQLFTLCLVFFMGSMLHLRVLLRDRRGIRKRAAMRPDHAAPWTLASVLAAAFLAWTGWFPPIWVLVVAVPALLRAVFIRGRVLDRHMQIGLSEAVINVLFVSAIFIV